MITIDLSYPHTRIDRPTREQLDRCIAAHRPAIFSGIMAGQTATRSWDLPYLRAKLGSRPVKVECQRPPGGVQFAPGCSRTRLTPTRRPSPDWWFRRRGEASDEDT